RQKTLVNNLVVSLKGAGLWTKLKAIYPYVGGSATAHKWNLKDPRVLDAAYRITWSGGVTHNANGVTFDGSTGYGDTHLNALTVFSTSYLSTHNYVRSWTKGISISAGLNYDWSSKDTNGNNPLIDNGGARSSNC